MHRRPRCGGGGTLAGGPHARSGGAADGRRAPRTRASGAPRSI